MLTREQHIDEMVCSFNNSIAMFSFWKYTSPRKCSRGASKRIRGSALSQLDRPFLPKDLDTWERSELQKDQCCLITFLGCIDGISEAVDAVTENIGNFALPVEQFLQSAVKCRYYMTANKMLNETAALTSDEMLRTPAQIVILMVATNIVAQWARIHDAGFGVAPYVDEEHPEPWYFPRYHLTHAYTQNSARDTAIVVPLGP